MNHEPISLIEHIFNAKNGIIVFSIAAGATARALIDRQSPVDLIRIVATGSLFAVGLGNVLPEIVAYGMLMAHVDPDFVEKVASNEDAAKASAFLVGFFGVMQVERWLKARRSKLEKTEGKKP